MSESMNIVDTHSSLQREKDKVEDKEAKSIDAKIDKGDAKKI